MTVTIWKCLVYISFLVMYMNFFVNALTTYYFRMRAVKLNPRSFNDADKKPVTLSSIRKKGALLSTHLSTRTK